VPNIRRSRHNQCAAVLPCASWSCRERADPSRPQPVTPAATAHDQPVGRGAPCLYGHSIALREFYLVSLAPRVRRRPRAGCGVRLNSVVFAATSNLARALPKWLAARLARAPPQPPGTDCLERRHACAACSGATTRHDSAPLKVRARGVNRSQWRGGGHLREKYRRFGGGRPCTVPCPHRRARCACSLPQRCTAQVLARASVGHAVCIRVSRRQSLGCLLSFFSPLFLFSPTKARFFIKSQLFARRGL